MPAPAHDVVLVAPPPHATAKWRWIVPVACKPVIVSASDASEPADLLSTHCAVMLQPYPVPGNAPPFPLSAAGGPMLLALPHLTLVALYTAVSAADWIADVGFVRTVVARLALRGLLVTPSAACFALARVETSCAISVDRDNVRRVIDAVSSWLTRTPSTPAVTLKPSVAVQPRLTLCMAPWRDVQLSTAVGLLRDVSGAQILRHSSTIDLTNGGTVKVLLKDAIKALLARPLRAVALLILVQPSAPDAGAWWTTTNGHTPVLAWVLDAQRTSLVVELAAAQARARRQQHFAPVLSLSSPLHQPPDHPALLPQDARFAVVLPTHSLAVLSDSDAAEIAFTTVNFTDAPQRFQPAQLQQGTHVESSREGMFESMSWSFDHHQSREASPEYDRGHSYGNCPTFDLGAEAEVGRFFSLGHPDDRRVSATSTKFVAEVMKPVLRPIARSDGADAPRLLGQRRTRGEASRVDWPLRPVPVYHGLVPASNGSSPTTPQPLANTAAPRPQPSAGRR